jgi:hypothetical protein
MVAVNWNHHFNFVVCHRHLFRIRANYVIDQSLLFNDYGRARKCA